MKQEANCGGLTEQERVEFVELGLWLANEQSHLRFSEDYTAKYKRYIELCDKYQVKQ